MCGALPTGRQKEEVPALVPCLEQMKNNQKFKFRQFDVPKSTVRVTTSPTQLGFPKKLARTSKDFVLGRKPMKRMLLPQ